MKLPKHTRSHRARQAGLSLVELIIAMVIGLTVVGAALSMYISSGFSSRGGSAMSQMTEDASIALSLLRSQVAMAGYSKPTGATASGMTKGYNGTAIFGCTGGATSNTAALAAMTCGTDATLPDSFVVLYEADTSNTVPTAAGLPTDCLGNAVPVDAVSGLNIAENRYFLNSSVLSCRGGTNAPQPLVENVVDLKVTYGVAGTITVGTTTVTNGVATRYLTAADVSGTLGLNSDLWKQVTSARICIVVRSDSAVLDAPAPYFGCSGSVTPTDRFLYRAFTTTVVLQNRI